jgi:SAM-dependent methyltransferase
MRAYWEQRARLNAAFYVDTSLDYGAPDMERFLAHGRRAVEIALDAPPAVGPHRRGCAVEIGCGLGRICLALAERFEHVVGYDISPEMLVRARDLVPDPKVEFRETDGASLPGMGDGSADFVLTFTVFQHIPSVDVIDGYVAEAARVLAPGGVFALQWNSTSGAVRWRLRRAVMASLQRVGRGDRYGRDRAEFLGSRVPVARMRRMLADAGLSTVAVTGEGLFTWAWARKD